METLRAQSGVSAAAPAHPGRLRPFAYAAQLAATAFFFFLGAAFSPLAWLAWRLSGGRIPRRYGQAALRSLFRLFTLWMRLTGMLKLEASGFEALASSRGTIFVSNHPALLDAPFLLTRLPLSACVMRATLLKNPALCGGALLAGYVTNDSGPGFVRQGIEKISSGENLLVFPEGTRTVSRPVNRFKNGFALVAARTGAPVCTLLVDYPGAHLTKGGSLLAPADVPLRFSLRVGKLFELLPGESPVEFSRRIETWFRRELERTRG